MNTPLRCALYARYSTDKQNPLSIGDQVRKCSEYAKSQGWLILDHHVYSDEAVSGASRNRVGLQRMLKLAESPNRPFDVIVAEDASRLSRRQADVLDICERLIFSGVRICFVSQGIDSSDEKFQFMIAARGMIDQVFLADTSKRVHRGMEGLVSRGRHTGGRCFGYARREVPDGVELVIDQAQAEIVRRIFNLYASGNSLKTIAKTLNAEGIEAPRAQHGRVGRSWSPTALQHILKNSRYTGRILWNTTKKVRDPRSGKRVKRARPKEEWLTQDAPHLRIISDELYEKVQRRFQEMNCRYGRLTGHPGLQNGQRGRRYIFSGFLKCSECGANIVLVSGRGRRGYERYGCPQNFYRGTCTNKLKIRRDVLESALLEGLRQQVIRPEAVKYITERLSKRLAQERSGRDLTVAQLRQRKLTLEAEINRLVQAIASGLGIGKIRAALLDRERELGNIEKRLSPTKSQTSVTNDEPLRQSVIAKLDSLRELLAKPGNVPETRRLLEEQVGEIVLHPIKHEGVDSYLATGKLGFLTGEEVSRWVGAAGRS